MSLVYFSLTHLLTHRLIRRLTHSLTHSYSLLLTHSLTHLRTLTLIHSLIFLGILHRFFLFRGYSSSSLVLQPRFFHLLFIRIDACRPEESLTHSLFVLLVYDFE